MTIYRADTVFDGKQVLGCAALRTENDRIVEVIKGGEAQALRADVDFGSAMLVPGFVDVHSHGGGGAAFTEGMDSARTVIATHLNEGTTSIMASLVTDTLDNLEAQIRALAPLYETDEILGIHLEGPWMALEFKGAHNPELLRDPQLAEVQRLCQSGPVKMVTVAIEREGGQSAVRWMVSQGIIAAPGHTNADYDQMKQAIANGAQNVTHLFNAMKPIHHRQPGPIVAALETAGLPVEVIADGVHSHPATVKHVFAAKGTDTILVTDAMAAAGSPDGDYMLGPLEVEVKDSVARLKSNGSIAGSTLTLSRALRFATYTAGVDMWLALQSATSRPATLLERSDIGTLTPGAYADMVVESADLHVQHVFRRGQQIR